MHARSAASDHPPNVDTTRQGHACCIFCRAAVAERRLGASTPHEHGAVGRGYEGVIVASAKVHDQPHVLSVCARCKCGKSTGMGVASHDSFV